MKSFTDVFPSPYGVIFEGGEFVAEFPEANKDAYIQNKKLNAWIACAKAHDNDYIAFSEYITRLENDLIKECAHTQSLTKTLEHRTKKTRRCNRLATIGLHHCFA